MTLIELAAAAGSDNGGLSRLERGEKKAPNLPRALQILKALGIADGSPEWHELLSAAAQDRFESFAHGGITYLGHENPLHGLPPEQPPPRQFSLTEAAVEIGRIAATRGITKIVVETSDGSEWFLPVREEEGDPPKG